MVRIRMQRMGRTHRPFYRINAIEKRNPRDGKVLENLGWFNPVEQDETKQVVLKADRIKHWIESGAQPSDTVWDLLRKHEIVTDDAWKKGRGNRLDARVKLNQAKRAAEAAAAPAETSEAS